MFIKLRSGFSVSVENTDFIASIYNIGEKLFFLYGYNGSGQPIRVYKSVEEAKEVVSRICEEMARGSIVYELPQVGFSEQDSAHTENEAHDTTFLDATTYELRKNNILSLRPANCLGRANLTLRDVLDMDLESIKSIRNLGIHSVDEIVRVLHEHGYKMAWEREDKK